MCRWPYCPRIFPLFWPPATHPQERRLEHLCLAVPCKRRPDPVTASTADCTLWRLAPAAIFYSRRDDKTMAQATSG